MGCATTAYVHRSHLLEQALASLEDLYANLRCATSEIAPTHSKRTHTHICKATSTDKEAAFTDIMAGDPLGHSGGASERVQEFSFKIPAALHRHCDQ